MSSPQDLHLRSEVRGPLYQDRQVWGVLVAVLADVEAGFWAIVGRIMAAG